MLNIIDNKSNNNEENKDKISFKQISSKNNINLSGGNIDKYKSYKSIQKERKSI